MATMDVYTYAIFGFCIRVVYIKFNPAFGPEMGAFPLRSQDRDAFSKVLVHENLGSSPNHGPTLQSPKRIVGKHSDKARL